VSALLIPRGEEWAILTDRDLRTRVVAERGSFDRPVEQIATHPVHVAQTDTLAGEAMLQMLELDIHHLPVSDRGRVVGMITDTDLLDWTAGARSRSVVRSRGRPPSRGRLRRARLFSRGGDAGRIRW
jgi:signal-transduction protein with cAMP-binding, CBS, and nucleotidyltransferase domain